MSLQVRQFFSVVVLNQLAYYYWILKGSEIGLIRKSYTGFIVK